MLAFPLPPLKWQKKLNLYFIWIICWFVLSAYPISIFCLLDYVYFISTVNTFVWLNLFLILSYSVWSLLWFCVVDQTNLKLFFRLVSAAQFTLVFHVNKNKFRGCYQHCLLSQIVMDERKSVITSRPRDCLACKLVSGLGLSGIGAYVAKQAFSMKKGYGKTFFYSFALGIVFKLKFQFTRP